MDRTRKLTRREDHQLLNEEKLSGDAQAIAQAKVKTDKIDAEVLAQLLRCDYLPAVWERDALTRQLRQLTTYRTALIGDRTRIKNRLQCVLNQRLIKSPVKHLFSKAGIEWLQHTEDQARKCREWCEANGVTVDDEMIFVDMAQRLVISRVCLQRYRRLYPSTRS